MFELLWIGLVWIGFGILTSVLIIEHSIELVQRWIWEEICEERKKDVKIN